MKRVKYDCLYNVYGSDHRAVVAAYDIEVE